MIVIYTISVLYIIVHCFTVALVGVGAVRGSLSVVAAVTLVQMTIKV